MPPASSKLGRYWLAATLAGVFGVSSGCGDGKIRRYPVSGTVTVGGQTVEGLRLIFCPVGGGEEFQKERPSGFTDASGEFSLTTFERGDGAPAGDYQIMILNARTRGGRGDDAASASGPNIRIDRKYAKPETSGLTATVRQEATVLDPIDLEAAPSRGRR